jgi:hypothetical protein
VRRAGLFILAGTLAAALLTGCGSHKRTTAAELSLERADLLTVVHRLQGLEGQLDAAIAASRTAWPFVVNGPSGNTAELGRAQVERAAAAAAAITVPAVLGEMEAAELTGPASPTVGVFRTFISLVPRGWRLTASCIAEIEDGPPTAAKFARETIALYIESIYDGYFSLAQVGKKVSDGYKSLGGAPAFGASLTEAEVQALAGVYSEARFRLHPHTGVKLGS